MPSLGTALWNFANVRCQLWKWPRPARAAVIIWYSRYYSGDTVTMEHTSGASDHIITGFSPHNDNGFISIVIATHRSKFRFAFWLYWSFLLLLKNMHYSCSITLSWQKFFVIFVTSVSVQWLITINTLNPNILERNLYVETVENNSHRKNI